MTTIELVEMDPAELQLGPNVRIATLDKTFVQSIKERGVLEPIVAYREDDQVVVLHGARRTLGAVQAKRPAVPVMVVDKPVDADRLVDQFSENEHRQGLSAAERIGAYEQLAALGVSPAQIARRTASPRPDVDAGLVVASSAAARQAVADHPLTVEQAAALVEFEGDADAVEALVAAAQRGGFEHQVTYQRNIQEGKQRQAEQAAAEAALMAKTAAELRAAGQRVVDEPDAANAAVLVEVLWHDGEPLTDESHADCPGAAVILETDLEWDDDADEDDPGHLVCIPTTVCVDYTAHGHTWGRGGMSSPAPAPANDADAAAEAARADRREVIAMNKAWDAAQGVRREWLGRFLARKTAPKGAALFVAESLALAEHGVRDAMSEGNQLAHQLLGSADGDTRTPAYGPAKVAAVSRLMAGVTEARAQVISLGILLGAYEEWSTRDRWRRVDETTQRYLRYLEGQGYDLSDVERRACGDE